MDNFTYKENGKIIAEFVDAQSMIDFIVLKTKRICDAEYILGQRKRDNEIKNRWLLIGFLLCGVLIHLIAVIIYLIKN